jgi:hypothetical protein
VAFSFFDAASWATTTGTVTCTATWALGDEVLIWGFGESDAATLATPTATGLGTVTLVTSILTGGQCTAYLWRATATSAQTGQTISSTKSGGSLHAGIAATVIPGGVSSLTALTGSNAEAPFNSAVGAGDGVAVGFSDFTATLGAGAPSTGSGTATERVEFVNSQYGVWIADWEGTSAGTFDFGRSSYAGLAVAQVGAKFTPAVLGPSVTQTHARWGLDDGTESGHTFAAAEDTPITAAAGLRRLLRVQLDETAGASDVGGKTVQYKRSDEGTDQWRIP